MFKNFNHKFVYKYPLIWNTKIVPLLLISILIHLLFFILGYQNAIVTSIQLHSYYNQESNATTINLFAVLISVLIFIIWCVLYFRNNGFKAFYPKTNHSLFKEWILILLFCIVNFSYVLSSIFGANLQTRSIMPQKLALERCETISKAEMFLHGSFKEDSFTNEKVNGKFVRIERDSFPFEEKNYTLNSLMNKNIESFPFFDEKQDSLTRLQVQRWMKADNKNEILTIFKNYLAIANEHRLKSNISAEKWMDLIYDYPEFTNYKVIGNSEYELENDYGYYQEYSAKTTQNILLPDSASTSIKNVNGQSYIYSKYYVSDNVLSAYYKAVATSWQNPLLGMEFIMVLLYLSFGFSLLIFSFKVTSARNWLIALVALGVTGIIFGVGTLLLDFSMAFPILYLLYHLAICVYLAIIYTKKRGKRLSGIALNQILWLIPGSLPVLYTVAMDIAKSTSGYDNRYDGTTRKPIEQFPKIDWFDDNAGLLAFVNLILIVFVLFILSRVIKKWRGIPEE
jgi:NADH:ubiquinone oxidoreductase subunit 6 (subunit J)